MVKLVTFTKIPLLIVVSGVCRLDENQWVNRQLPPWNCKFRQLPPLKLHNVNQFTSSIKFFCYWTWRFANIPLKFCTYVQNVPQTWKFIFFCCVMRTIVCQNFIYLLIEFLIICGYYLRRKTNTTKVKIIQVHWFPFSNIEQISVMIQAKQMRHDDELLEVEDMFYVGVAVTN